ncbi:u3 small nucleolar rna-associated protein [Lasius niger]|uniref:U3 small nucleolar rna-associated protein n=1 Tax=Lasius niger TaxID=67767 RepID=A0A0J7KM29_LASNI|nr:u3 small nucleolar rna-associated protein [Lasius niger]
MVDRCCSPVWSSDAPVFPASAGAPCSEGFGASPPGSRDITALEQSLLDHIEALFAQRNSLHEDLGRIRREMDDPCMDSVSSALEEGPGEPKDTTEAKRRRTRRRRRRPTWGALPALRRPLWRRMERLHRPARGL